MSHFSLFVFGIILALGFGYVCHILAERKLSKSRMELANAEARGKPYSDEVKAYMLGSVGFLPSAFAFFSFVSFVFGLFHLAYWIFP